LKEGSSGSRIENEKNKENQESREKKNKEKGRDEATKERRKICISLQHCKMNDARASHINANQGTMKAANTSKLGQQIKIE
jgi:hypothetical protein